MKITLIKPNIGRREHSLYVDNASMEPLQLGILAALTPPDVEVVMYDDRLEPIPYEEKTDLAAITVETFTARRAYEIADEYRRRGVKVLMGGIHVKLLPEEVKAHADSIMVGDAESGWAHMIADLKEGCLKEEYVCQSFTIPQKGVAISTKEKNTCRSPCCSSAGDVSTTANTAPAVCILNSTITRGMLERSSRRLNRRNENSSFSWMIILWQTRKKPRNCSAP